jgi:hypothetical protein
MTNQYEAAAELYYAGQPGEGCPNVISVCDYFCRPFLLGLG